MVAGGRSPAAEQCSRRTPCPPSRGPGWRARIVGSLWTCAFVATATGCRHEPPLLPATRADGQWIWSAPDQARWQAAARTRPALRPGLWVSTLWWEAGAVHQRLARSPAPFAPTRTSGATGVPLAIVVRLDDRFHAAWAAAPDSAIGAQLDDRLRELLRLVEATGARVREVQLDYDCPVRRLARWAAVVRQLHAGALTGRELWITSLVAHVAQPTYGAQFRGAVSGHIVQLFDVFGPGGADARIAPTPAAADHLRTALERAHLPFRLGLGAFERVLPAPVTQTSGTARLTQHRGWFALAPQLARSASYRGLWIFPGGQPWESLVQPTPP